MTADIASIQPNASTPFERIEETVSAERWPEVDVDIIRRSKDPWTCPEHLLNFLAFERSVDVWDPTWTLDKKRRVIAQAIADHRLKGTEEGTRRYIDHAGGELMQVVTPPQGIFSAPDLTKEQWDAWIRRHPKVRITLAHGVIDDLDEDSGIFADFSFSDWSYDSVDYGPVLHGRRAYIMRGTSQEPLQLWHVEAFYETEAGVDYERITIPGLAGDAIFSGDSFSDVNFVDAVTLAPSTHTVALDRLYRRIDADLITTVVPISHAPIDTTFERESETWDEPWGVYADWSYSDNHFLTPDISAEMLADVIYLLDPAVPPPEMIGVSFADISRVGMDHHTARMLVDLRLEEIEGACFADLTAFADIDFSLPADESREAFMLDAITASQRLSDLKGTGVSFGIWRPRTLDDGIPLDGSYQLGGFIRNWL